MTGAAALDAIDRRILNEFQDGLPLTPRPFAWMAQRLGITEDEVLRRLQRLQRGGQVSRVGAVFRPHSIGASTLAAMAVPPERLEAVADRVSRFPGVNHNYEREHRYNLWFVVTAPDEIRLADVLDALERETGLPLLRLPMLESFRLNLGFHMRWN